MPVRTVNLKLVLGKKSGTAELRQALWFTHSIVNEAVAMFEKMLLLCRGDAYWTVDAEGNEKLVPVHEVSSAALKLARTVQKTNGIPFVGTDGDILDALRTLYERIVPSCLLDEKGNPQTGDAQSSNAWVSPLMDPESQGGRCSHRLPHRCFWVSLLRSLLNSWHACRPSSLASASIVSLLRSLLNSWHCPSLFLASSRITLSACSDLY